MSKYTIIPFSANLAKLLRLAGFFCVALLTSLFLSGQLSAQTNSILAEDVYRASLAIDHIRDVRYGGGNRQDPGVYIGDDVLTRLQSQNRDAPSWNATTLLNGNASQYRLRVFRDHGPSKLNFSIFSDSSDMYVVFWGTTDELDNMVGNAALPVVNPAYDNSITHAGWAGMAFNVYNTVLTEMQAQEHQRKRVIFTGHSQGAAVVGHLTYLMLKNNQLASDRDHRLVHFGGPRYADPSLRQNFYRYVRANTPKLQVFDIEVEEDPIPNQWTDIITAGTARLTGVNDILNMGYRINRPKRWATRQFQDPHNHLNYVYLADRMKRLIDQRPPTFLSSPMALANRAKDGRLAEPRDKITIFNGNGSDFRVVTITLQKNHSITWWKGLKF